MLEHPAAHCANLDPSETALFANEMNDVIIYVFTAVTEGKGNDTSPPVIPNGWADAMNCVEHEKWVAAAHIELKAQIKNGTWRVVDCKSNKTKWKPLTLRRVFDIKKDDGRYKARPVARGFNQIKNVDSHKVYAVVAKPISFKVFYTIAAALNWFLHYVDVKTAFLNADTKESIYTELPENRVAGGAKQIAEKTKQIQAKQALKRLFRYLAGTVDLYI
ncbi:hypothetical protein VN97_g4516 [Penicillium thymicola]|uniref:Reverse transcriptase Ty1/copia-type domain-containing protein n=1 Tax=Penicillium thymicola TaxID=293382 RepID=A0AAI9TKC7_PENTH|nr:hypothetical protein VN97_g4516 [Penicillium thymicola]